MLLLDEGIQDNKEYLDGQHDSNFQHHKLFINLIQETCYFEKEGTESTDNFKVKGARNSWRANRTKPRNKIVFIFRTWNTFL